MTKRGGGDDGDLGLVVGGCDLDDVHADETAIAQTAENRKRLGAGIEGNAADHHIGPTRARGYSVDARNSVRRHNFASL